MNFRHVKGEPTTLPYRCHANMSAAKKLEANHITPPSPDNNIQPYAYSRGVQSKASYLFAVIFKSFIYISHSELKCNVLN